LADLIEEKRLIQPSGSATAELDGEILKQEAPLEVRSPEVEVAYGWSALNQGRSEEASRLGVSAVRRDATIIEGHLLLGYAYSSLGRLDKAATEWHHLDSLYAARQ
jgi:Flp pilus assembly protein TadD